jgi:hypothetical protein
MRRRGALRKGTLLNFWRPLKLFALYVAVLGQVAACNYPISYPEYARQAFSQKGVQASWDAPRTKNGRLWTPKFWGKREIIFNNFPKYINISKNEIASILIIIIHLTF